MSRVRIFTIEEISGFLREVARGDTTMAALARRHKFKPSDFRRWEDKYGMPVIRKEPTAAQLEALRGWRDERSRERMWKRFRKAAELADEHAEVPPSDGPKTDSYEHLAIEGWIASRALLVCEKKVVFNTLHEWKERRPSFSYERRLALASTSWLPSRRAVDALVTHARNARAAMAWFGDLDPQAIHWFATVRAGGRHELLQSSSRKLAIEYLGMDSAWLAWVARTAGELRNYSITMHHTDREYWQVVQRLVPDVRKVLGRQACELLDGGAKLEVDSLIARHREAFLRELGRRLKSVPQFK